MKRERETARARLAETIKAEFAALARLRAALEDALDAGDMAAARDMAGRFGPKAQDLRRLLAAQAPETVPPPEALDAWNVLADDDRALRLALPDRLQAVMSWLGRRRRTALAALGDGRRRLRRLARLAAALALAACQPAAEEKTESTEGAMAPASDAMAPAADGAMAPAADGAKAPAADGAMAPAATAPAADGAMAPAADGAMAPSADKMAPAH